jgi:hypothetical protein
MMDYREHFKEMRKILERYQYIKLVHNILGTSGFQLYVLSLKINKLEKCIKKELGIDKWTR